VDLARVKGTGSQGRVTKEDVQRAAAGPAAGPRPTAVPKPTPAPAPAAMPAAAPTALPEERIPLRGLRRKIAEKMTKSKQTAPHFTYVEEVDMTEMVALRKEAGAAAEEQGLKLSYLPFIVKALIAALKKYPLLNSSLDDEKEEIVIKKYYNVGIAVATSNGLIVPVIKQADQKSIIELVKEIDRLAAQAREGTIKLEDLHGSTFTITSLGVLGGIFATPIINHPEVAILGIHRIHQRPIVRDGQIVVRDMMYMSLSFDHRVIDGAIGAEFARYMIKFLENPNLLFMQMV
jgi:pyruvate dehydrogenase E2 component (dihydrolipoamide acetyltransferase)